MDSTSSVRIKSVLMRLLEDTRQNQGRALNSPLRETKAVQLGKAIDRNDQGKRSMLPTADHLLRRSFYGLAFNDFRKFTSRQYNNDNRVASIEASLYALGEFGIRLDPSREVDIFLCVVLGCQQREFPVIPNINDCAFFTLDEWH